MAKVSSLLNTVFQLDKDWVTRATMGMIVLSIVWGRETVSIVGSAKDF